MLGNYNTAGDTLLYNNQMYQWRDWWDTYHAPSYVTYTSTNVTDDKPGIAFKVLKALIVSKRIEVKTGRQFVDLMEEIIKAL